MLVESTEKKNSKAREICVELALSARALKGDRLPSEIILSGRQIQEMEERDQFRLKHVEMPDSSLFCFSKLPAI